MAYFKDKFGTKYTCDFDFKDCNTLILSGGALKCIYFLGVLFNLKKELPSFKYFAGTSCGTIIVTLISIGYTPYEIFQIFNKTTKNLKLSLSKTLETTINILESMFEKKGFTKDITFKQFEICTGKQLAFIASNISKLKEEILCSVTHPNTPIIIAIKLSCSLPIIFPTSKWNNDIYSDGIFFDNFPIKLSKLFKYSKKVIAISTLNSHYDKRILEYYKNPDIYKIILIPDLIKKYFFATPEDLFCMFVSGENYIKKNLSIKRKRRNSI